MSRRLTPDEQARVAAIYGGERIERVSLFGQQEAEIARLRAINAELLAALEDMLSGWRYIREVHGDLYGVAWDRVETAYRTAIKRAKEAK